MELRRLAALIAVVLLAVPAVIVADAPESEAVRPGSSMVNAIPVDITLYYQETDARLVNTNLQAFDFVQEGDGYSISIIKEPTSESVSHILEKDGDNLQIVDTWPENNVKSVTLNGVSVKIQKRDEFSNIALLVQLTAYTNNTFFVKYWVRSYGFEQEVYYRYNITYAMPMPYEISFEPALIRSDGVFSTQGTISFQDEIYNPQDYKFYATGLYRGLTLRNDLVIAGCVDETDSRWAQNTSMNVQIICTELSTGAVTLIGSRVDYSFSEAPETVIFTLKEDGVTKLSNNSEGRSVAVLAGTDLKLTLDKGSNATVYFKGDSGLEKTFLFSSDLNKVEQTLPTDGAGKYVVNMRQLDGTTDQITIAVISTLLPMNKIILTCSPL